MARGFEVFQKFESGKYVHLEDLKHLTNHICGNLNGDYCLNYKFWYNMYSYSSKAFIVCHWGQSEGLQPVAKWGEAICENNLVIFLKNIKTVEKVVIAFIINSFFVFFCYCRFY